MSVRARKRLRESEIDGRGWRRSALWWSCCRWWCVVVAVLWTWTEPNCPVWLSGDRVAGPGHEQVNSQLRNGGAVDLGKLHFEQHFLRPHRTEGQNIDHVFGVGLSDHSRTLGDVFGRDMAGEHDGGPRWRNGDLFVREDALFFFRAALTSTSTRKSKLCERSSSSQISNDTSPAARPCTRI